MFTVRRIVKFLYLILLGDNTNYFDENKLDEQVHYSIYIQYNLLIIYFVLHLLGVRCIVNVSF